MANKIMMVFLLFVLLFFMVILVKKFIMDPMKRRKILESLPTLNSKAKVISKYTSVQGGYTVTLYFVTFELDSKERVTFQIGLEQYGEFIEGETGMLTYKNGGGANEFLDFKSDE